MNHHLLRIRPLAAALAIIAIAGPAAAQQAAVDLDTIRVTAQKREQQVQEMPIAISAYSGEFLADYDVRNFTDIGNLVPGLVVQEQSPNNPGFVIRGITSDSGEANVEPRVSIFQDGVSISKSRGSIVQPFDLERVEVLRGPQGTLFGRGAQIGAIHLVQNKAHDGHKAAFTLGAGNHGAILATGVVNAPLAERLYGRLAVYHEQRDGFIENLSGGDLNGKDTQALRASFRLDLRDTDTLDLILNYQKDTPPGTAFRSGVIPTRRFSTDVLDGTADLNRAGDLGLDRTVRGATLLGEFALTPAWSLSSITGWRDFDSHEEFDADGSQLYGLEAAEIAKGRQVSQEFRFNYDGGGLFTGFAGLSYFRENGTQDVPLRLDERSLITLPAFGLGIPPLLADGTPNTLVTSLPIAPGIAAGLVSGAPQLGAGAMAGAAIGAAGTAVAVGAAATGVGGAVAAGARMAPAAAKLAGSGARAATSAASSAKSAFQAGSAAAGGGAKGAMAGLGNVAKTGARSAGRAAASRASAAGQRMAAPFRAGWNGPAADSGATAGGAGGAGASGQAATGEATSGAANAQPAWAKRLHRRQQFTHAATTTAHALRGGDGGGSGQGPSLRDSDS